MGCPKTVISTEQYKECPMSVVLIRLCLNVFAENKLECIYDNKITHIWRL